MPAGAELPAWRRHQAVTGVGENDSFEHAHEALLGAPDGSLERLSP